MADEEKRRKNAEKMRKYRLKHKERYRNNNRIRMRRKYEQEKALWDSNPKLKEETLLKWRTKKRNSNYRKALADKKNVSSTSTVSLTSNKSPYRILQVFGEALVKAQSALPKNPLMKEAVIRKLAIDSGIAVIKQRKKSSSGCGSEFDESKAEVEEFLLGC